MKKIEVSLLFLLMMVFVSCRASAIVGVSPGVYRVDFEPGLRKQFLFSYIFDEGVIADVYAEGDLEEYIQLSTTRLEGGGGVIVTLELPDNIEKPGDHKIYIGAKQSTSAGGTVGIIGNVRGIVLVRVPYPGKYAAIDFFEVTPANHGELSNFTLRVDNLGYESINAEAYAEIYNDENTSVSIIPLGSKYMESKEYTYFKKQVDTSKFNPGVYRAKAVVKYDAGELTSENTLRIGTLYVGLYNYTSEFIKDKINQFDIDVESFWNNNIPKVYAEVNIIGHNIEFLTPSMDLRPWKQTRLSGFFDTTGIEEDKFQANITLHYEGKETNEIVDVRFKKETNYTLYALIGGGIFLGILLISIIIAMIILFMRVGKNGKKS